MPTKMNQANFEKLMFIYSCLDLTSLNLNDNEATIKNFCEKINQTSSLYPKVPEVSAVCVFPSFIKVCKKNLKSKKIAICSVVGGFPYSQTFIDIKVAETKMAILSGATECDMVMPIGKFLQGDTNGVINEIKLIKNATNNKPLKVIIETDILKSRENIYNATMLAIEGGADFIKTSSGKTCGGATLEAVDSICEAIHHYYLETDKKIGIKPAGGITTTQKAIDFLGVIEKRLGKSWLTPSLFRIGASSLANAILTELSSKKTPIHYF